MVAEDSAPSHQLPGPRFWLFVRHVSGLLSLAKNFFSLTKSRNISTFLKVLVRSGDVYVLPNSLGASLLYLLTIPPQENQHLRLWLSSRLAAGRYMHSSAGLHPALPTRMSTIPSLPSVNEPALPFASDIHNSGFFSLIFFRSIFRPIYLNLSASFFAYSRRKTVFILIPACLLFSFSLKIHV